jgi:hypothetical protein
MDNTEYRGQLMKAGLIGSLVVTSGKLMKRSSISTLQGRSMTTNQQLMPFGTIQKLRGQWKQTRKHLSMENRQAVQSA